MAGALKVLAVGTRQTVDWIRDALLPRRRFSLSTANTYWDLCSISMKGAQSVSIAVLGLSSCDRELRRSAEYIRRRWPDAQIIYVGHQSALLEDQLYDERVPPESDAQGLLGVVNRLLERKRRLKRMTAGHVPRAIAKLAKS